MARFTDLERGSLARLKGIECTTLSGQAFTVDLGIMTGAQEEACVGAAQKRAREIGVSDSENDINFQFAYAVEAVLVSALDPDSPESAPVRFFDSAEQIRQNLDRERILFLSESQRSFQERVSPRTKHISEEDFYVHVVQLLDEQEGAGPSDHPFWMWPRLTQESFLRSMATQLVASQPLKSAHGFGAQAAAKPS